MRVLYVYCHPLPESFHAGIRVEALAGLAEAGHEVDLLDLDGYGPHHATRADLLRRLGRLDEATAAYDEAIAWATSDAERSFLEERRRAAGSG